MKALLAIDDDRPSREAVRAAATWLPAGAEIVALHVGPTPATLAPPTAVGVGAMPYTAVPAGALPTDEELEAMAHELADQVCGTDPGGVRIERGDPANTICRVAEEIGADLIVIGTGDRSWLNRLFEPSVSNEVVHHAPCSVLVVRDTDGSGS